MTTTYLEDIDLFPHWAARSRPSTTGDRLANRARAAIRLIAMPARALVRHYRDMRAILRLEALDDRILEDIGIARWQIPEVVRSRRLS